MYERILKPCSSTSAFSYDRCSTSTTSFAEKQKWKAITERIVEVISYLTKQNLALRRHREEEISGLSDPEKAVVDNVNVENFLAAIRLLAKYDVILTEHVQSAKEKTKSVTYFSNR